MTKFQPPICRSFPNLELLQAQPQFCHMDVSNQTPQAHLRLPCATLYTSSFPPHLLFLLYFLFKVGRPFTHARISDSYLISYIQFITMSWWFNFFNISWTHPFYHLFSSGPNYLPDLLSTKSKLLKKFPKKFLKQQIDIVQSSIISIQCWILHCTVEFSLFQIFMYF